METAGAQRIDHVAVIVTDVEQSRAFYAGVLGLREVPRPESFDFPGAWFEIGPTFLHLLGKPQPDPHGPRHFCLWVSDLRAAAARLEAARFRVEWKTNHKIPGIDRFFTHDPDGNRIEFQGPSWIRDSHTAARGGTSV
jgi:catechol 2,3-dioxygenase-like lactoylglutathione lyase family enzyme